jgi:hypothetical protein
MLAQAYECEARQIRQNFSNNRDRFVEGKHFYMLENKELAEFRLCVENFDSQISLSPKARNLTLWLERGAARHAKMLNTDRAWEVFEILEETFFRAPKQEPALPPAPASHSHPIPLPSPPPIPVLSPPRELHHGEPLPTLRVAQISLPMPAQF